ncbi:hypothetical protein HNQ80_000146 [Anaerosolibacter carboniphilus]|uniref:Uncharacterized protein n=1 Tax=Anaerosolibacter carboniphilus TaxID=1417629 RepID=A0A841KKV8_9FIRM|nr:hypothetical protein [Anaerosolibacter carboniphilus]MBB6214077.1 hypothetical protein [Anaerosolibacter carboniphilus]
MLSSIIIAGFITMILFVTLENFRRDMTLKHILTVNERLREFISGYLGDLSGFDVFMVKSLRDRIREDFMHQEQIDHFEISMIDSRHLKIAYEIDGTREEVEISTALGKVEITEMTMPEEVEGFE